MIGKLTEKEQVRNLNCLRLDSLLITTRRTALVIDT